MIYHQVLPLELQRASCSWFVKVPVIKPFITTHSFDILCLSETFLDSTIPYNYKNIKINGYSLTPMCMYIKGTSTDI